MAEPSIEAVVSRYREDVSWVRELSFSATIYDKSGQGGDNPLPNIGRESHTYLTHILKRYPDFPGYTVFLQGDPFKHMQEGAGPRELEELVREKAAKSRGFSGLAWYRIRCDRLGRPHDMRDEAKRGRWAGFGRDIPVGGLFETLFAAKAPETFLSGSPAGLFMVSRERILARPKGFYSLALAVTEADPDDAHNTGHAFERLWQVIFNGYRGLNREDYAAALSSLSWPAA
jgi:hypothetical protein